MSLGKKMIITGKIAGSVLKEKLIKENFKKRDEMIKRKSLVSDLEREVKTSKSIRAESYKNLSFVEKTQKQFKSLPVFTFVDDLVEGASGIQKIEALIKADPNQAFLWLVLAECVKYRRKTFLIINGLKAPIDPIGTVLDIGSEYAGDYIELFKDNDRWNYEKALMKALELGIKGEASLINCVSAGRSAFLLQSRFKENTIKVYYNNLSKEYLTKAINISTTKRDKGELYFYLAQCFELEDINMALSIYKESKNYGFQPAVVKVAKILKHLKIGYKVEDLKIPQNIEKFNKFNYSYTKGDIEALVDGSIHMAVKQVKKLANTTEKIFDNIVIKTMRK